MSAGRPWGKLWGVGVGPGAADLLTLRALRVLQGADVLALPRSCDYGASMAWQIVAEAVGEVAGQARLFLTFPMNKDPARLVPAWDRALAALEPHLEAGRSVAFATEGDPSLFSTFTYLRERAPERWPGIEIEVVPGVTSVTAVPAVGDVVLADGQERVAILPGNYGVEDLTQVLQSFDTTVLMKIGPQMDNVVQALERTGLVDRAVFVSRATMAEQQVVRDVRAVRRLRGDCFAMMIVARKERSGLLGGRVAAGPLAPLPGPIAAEGGRA